MGIQGLHKPQSTATTKQSADMKIRGLAGPDAKADDALATKGGKVSLEEQSAGTISQRVTVMH